MRSTRLCCRANRGSLLGRPTCNGLLASRVELVANPILDSAVPNNTDCVIQVIQAVEVGMSGAHMFAMPAYSFLTHCGRSAKT